ncbi:MAG: flippase-like domain-containing protein [Bacteroidetes bacterium]|jgi:uncharacterized membrane protein YbhN (UPF0104 family)|nr:flippase-like domain-containing protein [Bacteroidota bacterium]
MKKLFKNKFINGLIKLLIVVLLLWAIYSQVFAKENIDDIWAIFIENFSFPNLYWLIFIVVLVPVNWGIEAYKWKQLIQNFTDLSFWKTYKAILAGITVSLFTPNRVGEYGGRILMVKAEHNWKAVIATLVGSFSQLLTLLAMGLLGAIYFSMTFLDPETYILQLIFFLGIAFISLMVFCFFNIDMVIPIARRIPFPDWMRRYLKHVAVLQNYTSKELIKVLLLSLFRYLIYSFQYFLALKFFGVEVPLIQGMAGIATIYLLQTSIPLPPLMGLLARGEVALFIWGFFSQTEVNILAASFSLFIINLAVPALLGAVFILQTNVLKSLGYEQSSPSSKTDQS